MTTIESPTEDRNSRSTSRSRIAGVFGNIKRAFSTDRGSQERASHDQSLSSTQSNVSGTTITHLESSRGRQFQASGRGGAGNISMASDPTVLDSQRTRTSEAEEAALQQLRESRSRSRGREEVFSGGRGGRGNITSPDRNTLEAIQDEEHRSEVAIELAEQNRQQFVGGRGGAGNRFTSPHR